MNSNLSLPISTMFPFSNVPLLIDSDEKSAAMRRLQPGRRLRPRTFTGCSSQLSAYPSTRSTFRSAVDQYFAACALEHPVWPAAGSDQRPGFEAAASVQDDQRQGCLGADCIASFAAAPAVTDADVEECGYLGWLRR